MIAAKLANMPKGANQHSQKEGAQICASTQDDAAELLRVSRRSVQTARSVLDRAAPNIVQAVESGGADLARARKKISE